MHRYQVAKYVIFDSEKIFVKVFLDAKIVTHILAPKETF
jgi:hypothetical protein